MDGGTRRRSPAAGGCPAAVAIRRDRGKRVMLLLIFVEFLVCLLIWWRGVVIALGDQPEHRNWAMLQQQRRADWVRNELQQRPRAMRSGPRVLPKLAVQSRQPGRVQSAHARGGPSGPPGHRRAR
jgi:hypothetical protein